MHKLPRIGLRGRLVLVALILLIIPWAGYSYIKATEQLLREQQERQLMAAARAVAAALHDRPRLATLREESPDGEAARAEVRAVEAPRRRTHAAIGIGRHEIGPLIEEHLECGDGIRKVDGVVTYRDRGQKGKFVCIEPKA